MIIDSDFAGIVKDVGPGAVSLLNRRPGFGATGGVGHFAVQAAKGAIVSATCSPSNFAIASELGADKVYSYASQKPLIESVYRLENSSEAFHKAEFGKPRGKVIIEFLNDTVDYFIRCRISIPGH